MRLIQYETQAGARQVGKVLSDREVAPVREARTVYAVAQAAIEAGRTLAAEVDALGCDAPVDYASIRAEGRLLAPLDHPDPAHLLVSGTGLTHLGSAATRDKMHQAAMQDPSTLTDSMKMFRWGLEGGKPAGGGVGVPPEWFYKGDGGIVTRPGGSITVPDFGEDAGDEVEIVGLYVIGADATPYRVGYALGNELSDHVFENRNYLYLAHSKLRFCSFGPEVLVAPLPAHVEGRATIVRNGAIIWEKPFVSGESNMSHTLDNLEYHHFKYRQFLRPGDAHVHYFGAAVLSYADKIRTHDGDEFHIEAPLFGAPLVNRITRVSTPMTFGGVRAL
jgi:hypothetical protein